MKCGRRHLIFRALERLGASATLVFGLTLPKHLDVWTIVEVAVEEDDYLKLGAAFGYIFFCLLYRLERFFGLFAFNLGRLLALP